MNQTTCRTGMLAYRTTRVRKALPLAAVAGLAIMLAGPVPTVDGQTLGEALAGRSQRIPDPNIDVERAAGRLKFSQRDNQFFLLVKENVTLGDIVDAISTAGGTPISIVLDQELSKRRREVVLPIELRNIQLTQLMETLVWHIGQSWAEPGTIQASGGPRVIAGNSIQAPNEGVVFRLSMQASATTSPFGQSESSATVEFFAITDLLDGMKRAGDSKPVESLQTSLDLGLQALREKGSPPEITVHAETGLLIVRATPRQMAVIRSAINAVQARTQSVLRKVWAEEKVLKEMKAIESQLHEYEEQAARLLKEAEALENSGAAGNRNPTRMAAEIAQQRARALRDRAAAMQLEATGRPALLDALFVGVPRFPEFESRDTEASTKDAAAATSDPVSAQTVGRLREQQAKIAEAERALEAARRQLEDLTRKLRDEQATKPADGGK